MRRTIVFAILASLGFAAQANEGGDDLSMRSRSMAAAASTNAALPKSAEAPFRVRRDPLPEMTYREEMERRGPRGACEASASDLCYDLADGRVVYRPVREYMPAMPGLRAESISVRHDRVVLKYSFR